MSARKKAASRKKTATRKTAARKKPATAKKARKAAPKAGKKAARPSPKKAAKKAAKKPDTKKTAKKAAPKTPPKAAPAPKKAGAGRQAPAIRSKKRGRRRGSGKNAPPPPHLVGAADPRKSKLGIKWACFSCGAKFYDLNQPEPLCPKCGSDQREAPATPKATPPPPPKAKEARPLPAFFDDDDGATRDESLTSEDLDMELGGSVGTDDDVASPNLDLDQDPIDDDD